MNNEIIEELTEEELLKNAYALLEEASDEHELISEDIYYVLEEIAKELNLCEQQFELLFARTSNLLWRLKTGYETRNDAIQSGAGKEHANIINALKNNPIGLREIPIELRIKLSDYVENHYEPVPFTNVRIETYFNRLSRFWFQVNYYEFDIKKNGKTTEENLFHQLAIEIYKDIGMKPSGARKIFMPQDKDCIFPSDKELKDISLSIHY